MITTLRPCPVCQAMRLTPFMPTRTRTPVTATRTIITATDPAAPGWGGAPPSGGRQETTRRVQIRPGKTSGRFPDRLEGLKWL